MKWLFVPLLLASTALAANPQDEQLVRNAYAKLAYAVQSRTVYDEAVRNPDLTAVELTKQLQANELRFEITEMTSGALSEIASRPYSDFVTLSSTEDVLQIVHDEETVRVNNKPIAVSNFAVARWMPGPSASLPEKEMGSDMSVNDVIVKAGNRGKYSRHVAATITVRYQGRSRTYRTLWLFGSETIGIDLVTQNSATEFVSNNVFPSVLTGTHLRSVPAVASWLSSTQRYEATCRSGRQEVCCNTEVMQCGIASGDVRSMRAAPSLPQEMERTAPKEHVQ
jgi:hypothetical protein